MAMSHSDLTCTACNGELVMQEDPENTDHESIRSTCQSCGKEADGEELVAHYVGESWGGIAYFAAKGEASTPIHHCPSCALETYLTCDVFLECAWCGHEMGECDLCEDTLTPENVSFDNESMCCYCDEKLNKD